MTYDIIVADPAWKFRDNLPGKGRGASKHYHCELIDELERVLSVEEIARDALLFLWRVACQQRVALELMRRWGFDEPKSEIIWVKLNKNLDHSKPRMGMGHYVRNAHETCLIGVRGRGASLIHDHGVPSVFFAQRTRNHSEKPREFFELIERLVSPDTKKLELFSRHERDGWTCRGDQVGVLGKV